MVKANDSAKETVLRFPERAGLGEEGGFRRLTPKEIGAAVAVIRKAMDMKQINLAGEAGVKERTVQRIENGEKVSDDSLRAIARAFRMDENSFLRPRHVLSEGEAIGEAQRLLESVMAIEAHRFETLKDADAVLCSQGMILQDRAVNDDDAECMAQFRDLLCDWKDLYGGLYSEAEKLGARRSMLDAAKELESHGYVIRYGVYNTKDDFRLVAMSIARKADDDLCAARQFVVPRRFTGPAWDSIRSAM